MSKKYIKLSTAVILFIISVIALYFSSDSTKSVTFNDVEEYQNENLYENEIALESKNLTINPTEEEGEKLENEIVISPQDEENEQEVETQEGYRVVKVVDGDTIDVDINGKVERLRLIGIDTPETVDPRKSVQCFGNEASNKAKELLSGQFVMLESDESQGERDKYKRLLRYVILQDGTNFNFHMIEQGYAHEYTYDEVYKYQEVFKKAENDARSVGKGLWNTLTCNGNV